MTQRQTQAQLLKLALTVRNELPEYRFYPPQDRTDDLVIEVQPGATVGDLTGAIVSHLNVRSSSRPRLLRVIVSDGEEVANEGARYLPPEKKLADCGLMDGATLRLADSGSFRARELFIDEEAADDDLYLIDERGTHRGRVTRLLAGVPVFVGRNPPYGGAGTADESEDEKLEKRPEERSVLVDDLNVAEHAITLTNRGGVFAQCTVLHQEGLYLSGAPADGSQERVFPGGTISFRRDDTDYVGFVITTQAGLHGRSPVGRVQFDVAARLTDPSYEALPEGVRTLPAQPEPPEPQTFPFEQVGPMLLMVGVLALVTRSPLALTTAPIAVVFPIANYVRQRRQSQRRHTRERDKWVAKLGKASEKLTEVAGREEGNIHIENPATEIWARRAYRRLAGLWGRDPQREDFLRVRLGLGKVPSRYAIQLAEGTDMDDPDFSKIMRTHGRQVDETEVRPELPDAPVTVSMREFHLGLAGPLELVSHVATDVLVQVACAHPPGVVGIAALLPAADLSREGYEWLKWLPHTRAGSALLPSARLLAGRQDGNAFLTEMRELHQERRQHRADTSAESYALLVVHEAAEVDMSLLEEVCELADGLVRVLWLGSSGDNAPKLVTSLVTIQQSEGAPGDALGEFRSGDQAGAHGPFALNLFKVPPARVAHALASLYDPRTSGANAGVPQSVPLSAVIDVEGIEYEDDAREEIGTAITAPIGLGQDGLLELDLVQDGPHMLIGGTTGAGKSELLQSLICSLLSRYSPDEVSLFLIDFKGGATFAPFQGLPHVVGYVTDMDQRNVNRALDFLRAELRRREEAFERMGHAKEYEDYLKSALKLTREQREEKNAHVIPRLVVIFDEFATIVKDFGRETIDAVVDIARRGRSWGVHLILATQQPSRDVVVPQVRGNVNARIALRTVSPDESMTIIDRPDAARIPKAIPGRALVGLDGNRLIEFQTAHSGAPFVPRNQLPAVTIAKFAIDNAKQEPSSPSGVPAPTQSVKTQLQALVESIVQMGFPGSPGAERLAPPLEVEHPREPGRPSAEPQAGGLVLSLGLRDLPRKQTQVPLDVNLSRGGLYIVGPNRSGVTTTLLTVAEAFASQVRAPRRAIVCLDGGEQLSAELQKRFANTVLIPLIQLDDVTRCVDQLWLEMRNRMTRDRGNGPGVYQGDSPILLLIDGFDFLVQPFSRPVMAMWAGRLTELLTAGRRQGIYSCISARQLRDVGASVLAAQGNVITLQGHYEDSTVPQDERLAGIGVDADGNLVQIYFPPARRKQPDVFPPTELTDYLDPDGWRRGPAMLNAGQAGLPAGRPAPGALTVTLGVDEIWRTTRVFDLSENHVLVIGRPRSGRTTFLLQLARELHWQSHRPVAMFSPRGLPGGLPSADVRLVSSDDLMEIHSLSPDARPSALDSLGCALLPDGRLVLLVDDAYAIESMENGNTLNFLLNDLYKNSLIQPVAVTAATAINGCLLTSSLKTSGATVYLKPSPDRSEYDDGVRVRSVPLRHRPGIVYQEGDALVQTDDGQLLVHLSLSVKAGIG